MKRILTIIFMLTTVYLCAEDFSLQFSEVENKFYYEIAGSWDSGLMKKATGSPRLFSWGMGEFVKSSSILIDYNLYDDDNTWDFQSVTTYKINSIEVIAGKVYKIKLFDTYEKKDGAIIIHVVEDGVIWFETVPQYEYSKGEIDKPDIPYGKEKAYYNGGVRTGPDNLYYRRSGPPETEAK